MNKQILMMPVFVMAVFTAMTQTVVNVLPQPEATKQKVTVEVENTRPPFSIHPRKVALIVQNHAAPGTGIPMMALTDALTAKLSVQGFQVINPYNVLGVNQNRSVAGETTPEVSALKLARELGADGVLTASILEFLDTMIGTPPVLHQYSVRVSITLADVWTGAAICGDTLKMKSRRYTNNQVAANRQEYLGELLHASAEECAAKLLVNPAVHEWKPIPPPMPLPPSNPQLTISDIDTLVPSLLADMRTSSLFQTNYDLAQKEKGRVPLAIVGGIVDLTEGKSPTPDMSNLLGAGSQTIRMTLLNSALFEAKDDAIDSTLAKRIIASGNSALEDGEIMSALKQHGSPDFFVLGDMQYFMEDGKGRYRLHLALHSLHTGKIVWEGVETKSK